MSITLDKANQILAEKQAKILPENIKKYVQIFDIEGTLEDKLMETFATEEDMRAATETLQNNTICKVSNVVENRDVLTNLTSINIAFIPPAFAIPSSTGNVSSIWENTDTGEYFKIRGAEGMTDTKKYIEYKLVGQDEVSYEYTYMPTGMYQWNQLSVSEKTIEFKAPLTLYSEGIRNPQICDVVEGVYKTEDIRDVYLYQDNEFTKLQPQLNGVIARIFDTVEDMQASDKTDIKPGERAIVYGDELEPFAEEKQYNKIQLFKTITLKEPINLEYTSTYYININTSDDIYIPSWRLYLTPDKEIMLEIYSPDYTSIVVNYTTEDNLTYTMGDISLGDEFAEIIHIDNSTGIITGLNGTTFESTLPDTFGKGYAPYLGGIYEFAENQYNYDKINMYTNFQINPTDYTLTYSEPLVVDWSNIKPLIQKIIDTDKDLTAADVALIRYSDGSYKFFARAAGNELKIFNNKLSTHGINPVTELNYYLYDLDLEQNTYSRTEYTTTTKIHTYSSGAYYEFVDLSDKYIFLFKKSDMTAAFKTTVMYVKSGATSLSSVSMTEERYVLEDIYVSLPIQCTLNDVNQLLPGYVAIGENCKTIIGDGSIYDNLDANEVSSRILNVDNYDFTTHVSDITDKGKLHFLKKGIVGQDIEHYIAKPNVTIYNIEKKENVSITWTTYNKKRDMIISYVRDYSGDTTVYNLIFENATTHEELYKITYDTSMGSLYGCTEDTLYVCDNSKISSDKTWTLYKYSLDTFERATLDSFSDSTMSSVSIKMIVNKNYIIYYYYAYNSSNKMSGIKMYDDKTNTLKTIMTHSTTSGSINGYLGFADTGSTIYLYVNILSGDGRFLSINKNTLDITTLWQQSSVYNLSYAMKPVYDNAFISGDYVSFGRVLANTTEFDNISCYAVIKDMAGNVITNKQDSEVVYKTIDGVSYVYSDGYFAKIDSYDIAPSGSSTDYAMYCNCSEIYKVFKGKYIYTLDNRGQSSGKSVYINFDTIRKGDDYYEFDIDDLNTNYIGTVRFLSCVKSSSNDYDYSLLVRNKDCLVQRQVNDIFEKRYDNTITPEEYSTCNNLASLALDNTPLVDDPNIDVTLDITGNDTIKVEDNVLVIEEEVTE